MATPRDVVQETNARFWVRTFYKPGEALNPADPADKRMATFWLDVYRDLLRRNAQGTLRLIHKHASFAQQLDDAIRAYRVERATNERDPRYVAARQAKAQALNEAVLWHEMLTGAQGSTAVSGWGGQPWSWYNTPY